MTTEEKKQIKHVHKEVDKVIKGIESVIPDNFTPYQVKAVFDLYMSLYE